MNCLLDKGNPVELKRAWAMRIFIDLVLERRRIRIAYLDPPLEGLGIALMSDHHFFSFTPKKLLEDAVEQINTLRPDLILLAGDHVARMPNQFGNLD